MRDEWFCQLKSKATGSQGIGGLFRFIISSGRHNGTGKTQGTAGFGSVFHAAALINSILATALGFLRFHSNSGRASFAGSDSNTVVHGQDKDFAVADLSLLARLAAFGNRFDRRFHKLFIDRNL